jgi:hypothetical protein
MIKSKHVSFALFEQADRADTKAAKQSVVVRGSDFIVQMARRRQ